MGPLIAVTGIVKALEVGLDTAANGAERAGSNLKKDILSAIGVAPTSGPAKSTLSFSSIKFPTLPNKTDV